MKYAVSYINIYLCVLGAFVTIISAHMIEHTVSVCFLLVYYISVNIL